MSVRELIEEVTKLNIQNETDVVALANIDGVEYEFNIIGVYQEGVPYIELEVTEKWHIKNCKK